MAIPTSLSKITDQKPIWIRGNTRERLRQLGPNSLRSVGVSGYVSPQNLEPAAEIIMRIIVLAYEKARLIRAYVWNNHLVVMGFISYLAFSVWTSVTFGDLFPMSENRLHSWKHEIEAKGGSEIKDHMI
jgi:hypothetical protein